jgi:hypothetical protein
MTVTPGTHPSLYTFHDEFINNRINMAGYVLRMNGERENPKECAEHVTKRKIHKTKTYNKMRAEVLRKMSHRRKEKHVGKIVEDGDRRRGR